MESLLSPAVLLITVSPCLMLNYFPHPSNLRLNDAVLDLRISFGSAGYGIFVQILELIRDSEQRAISNSPKRIAYAINEPDIKLVEAVISSPGIFTENEQGLVICPLLENLMEEYDNKKARAKEAGRKGALARYHAEDSQQPNSNPIATAQQPNSNNIIQDNIKRNITQPRAKLATASLCGYNGEDLLYIARDKGQLIDDAYISKLEDSKKEGYTPYFLARICQNLGLTVNQYLLLHKWTDGAKCGTKRYDFIISLRKHINDTNFTPKYMGEYILNKCVEFDTQNI